MVRKISVLFLVSLSILLSACAPPTATPTAAPIATDAPTAESTPSPTLEPVKLKVGVLSFLSHTPVHIAKVDGYFAEQDLDVELVDFGTSDRDMLAALLSGQLDAGAMIVSTATLHAMEQDGNLKIVADKGFIDPNLSCPTDAWVARTELLENGTLDTTEGLRGLQMTTSLGNTLEYANYLMLKQAGLTIDDMTVVDMRDQVARLDALGVGSLDLYGVSEPWITRAVNTGNAGIWKDFAEFIPDLTFATIVFGPNLLEQDTEVGVRFMVAYLNAVKQFSEGKTDRNIEVIAEITQLDPAEINELCWTSLRRDGKIDTAKMIEFQQWALEMGYTDTLLPIEQVWDPQYVDQAYEQVK
jgi:NitT/TauT family transport system substrate-binding protein